MSIPGIDWDEIAPKSGKLTGAELNARDAAWEQEHAAAFFAVRNYEPCCTGPCDKGRKPCPTTDACIKAMDDLRVEPDKYILRLGIAMYAVGAVFVVAVIVWAVKAVASWL